MVHAPPLDVEVPDAPRAQFGLFSAAPPKPLSERVGFGVQFRTRPCGSQASVWRSDCDTPPPPKGTSESDIYVEAGAFQIYARPECLNTTIADLRQQALDVLDLSAELEVERELQDALIASVPVTLTTGPLGIASGLILAECWLSQNYTGRRGVIHAPRGVAIHAARDSAMIARGDAAFTPLGTGWDFAGGFCDSLDPAGDTADEGTAWLYVTGQTHVFRGSPVVLEQQGGLALPKNSAAILAEQTYAVGWECGVAAVQICLTGGCV